MTITFKEYLEESSKKPTIKRIGSKYHVINSKGESVFSHGIPEIAAAHFEKHFNEIIGHKDEHPPGSPEKHPKLAEAADASHARKIISDVLKKKEHSGEIPKPLPRIPTHAERRKMLGLPDPLKKEELEILQKGLDESTK